jgi:mRNA interferase MazF
MICSPGDLVLIPFSDLNTTTNRPVLVLTAPDLHGGFVGLAVTSVPQPDPQVPIDAGSLTGGALPKPSWVRVNKVFTLEQALILRVFGKPNGEILQQVLSALCRRVGYP